MTRGILPLPTRIGILHYAGFSKLLQQNEVDFPSQKHVGSSDLTLNADLSALPSNVTPSSNATYHYQECPPQGKSTVPSVSRQLVQKIRRRGEHVNALDSWPEPHFISQVGHNLL